MKLKPGLAASYHISIDVRVLLGVGILSVCLSITHVDCDKTK